MSGTRVARDFYRGGNQPETLAYALIVSSFDISLRFDDALGLLEESREIADSVGATRLGSESVGAARAAHIIFGVASTRTSVSCPDITHAAERSDATNGFGVVVDGAALRLST